MTHWLRCYAHLLAILLFLTGKRHVDDTVNTPLILPLEIPLQGFQHAQNISIFIINTGQSAVSVSLVTHFI